MKRNLASVALVLGVCLSVAYLERVFANIPPPISISSSGTPYRQDFNTLGSSGSSNATPNGWAFSESGTAAANNGLYAAGTGSINTGDTYSFGNTAGDRALGGLLSGTFNTTFGAQFTNNTGATITSLLVSYTGEQWRLGQNTVGRAPDRIDFQYSTNATTLTSGNWTDVNPLDFSSPVLTGTIGALIGNNPPNQTAISSTITGLSIPNGASFFIRWTDFDIAPGADDGLAVDDFCVAANGGSCTVDTAPTVATTVPANGTPNVAVYSDIVINFSESVTAPPAAFALDCGVGTPAFSVSGSGSAVVTLNPGVDLPYSRLCTVSITASQVTDLDTSDPPDNMAANYGFSFTTAAEADTAPSVIDRSPAPGAANVAAASNIVITFSENVNAPPGAFSLVCGALSPAFGVSGSGSQIITLDPFSDLPYSTGCAVHVTAASITDTDLNDPPNEMLADVDFSFTTEARPPASNVMINEIDADTPGSPQDTAEFIELYDGGVGNTPLDGLTVVLYDGTPSGNVSPNVVYAAFDLDGFQTDPNGYFVLGNPGVNGAQITFGPGPFGTLQNGPDAVALYAANAADFTIGVTVVTAVPTTGLRDAIVYETDDADATALISNLTPGQPSVNENASGDGPNQSSQRCPNGFGGMRNTSAYVPFTPTPGAANQCPASRPPSGIVISQIYAGGGNSGAPLHNDFVEVFNRGTSPVDLSGWSIQYTSSTGSTWDQVQPIGGIIGPGEYFLVQMAAGTGGGAPLPVTPNIVGAINMGATAGKVLLADTFDSIPGGCPIFNPSVKDFVGYGSADCGEGGTKAPAPSNTTSIFRKDGPDVGTDTGDQDTDHNNADFQTGAPAPRRTTPIQEIGPFVFRKDPFANNLEAPFDPTIIVSFTEAVDVVDPWLTINCSVTGLHDSYTQAGGGTFHAVTLNVTLQPGETCTVTVDKDQIHDSDTNDSAPDTDMLRADVTWSFTVATGAPAPYPPNVHLTFGNPSNAGADPNNYLMTKPEFALSYDRDLGRPNWVSWHLSDDWTGNLSRDDTFRADPEVPATWNRVQSFDFSGSGFDRGHMTPNADRNNANSVPINQATFLMTNMIAQAPDNNQGPWAAFETYLRTLLPVNEVYIVAGPAGIGGAGSNGAANTIADGNVTVPHDTWKVALVLPKGTNDLSRVNCFSRTIAVKMPNTQGIRTTPWETFLTTVDDVEALSGYDVFSELPDGVEYCVEAGTNGVNPLEDPNPPVITCDPADGVWHDDNVTFSCTAEDAASTATESTSGLANPADASFTLVTSVADGDEDGNASTNSRQVCDRAGNCATAVVNGNKIDLKAPVITLTTPPDGAFYQVTTIVTASFDCVDAGVGLATCSGTVANGAAIDTATLGAKTFVVTATDALGNSSSVTATYNVVHKLPATIQINNIPSAASTGGSFTPAFDYTGQGTMHVDSLTQSVCKVTGGVVKFVSAGTCTLQARGTPNGVYDWAYGPLQSFVITP